MVANKSTNHHIERNKYFNEQGTDAGPYRVIIDSKTDTINKMTIGALLKKFKKNTGILDIKKNSRKK